MKTIAVFCCLTLGWLGAFAAEAPSTPPVTPVRPSPVPGLPAVPAAPRAANPDAAKTPGPRVQFETPVFDFGKVDSGQVLKHNFVFTNTGVATLEITEVRPGCGCTTAGTWDRRVEPGQTGSIPIQFNSGGFSGPVTKSVTVTCNDPTQPTVFLQIKATIWKAIDVNPPSAYFNISSENPTNLTRTVRIVNNLAEPLTVSDLVCTNSSFQAELKTITPGKEFEVQITAVPPFAASYVNSPVTLSTSSPRLPRITIPVSAYSQPPVTVMPAQITLPAGPLGPGVRPSITIRNTGTNVLVLSEAAVNLDGATAEVRELQPGRLFTLSLTLPPGLQLQPGQRLEASVKSNHPKYPVIKVPVFQSQRLPVASVTRPPIAGLNPAPAPLAVPGPVDSPEPVVPPSALVPALPPPLPPVPSPSSR